jgi:DNA polymerase III subunit gamma/tau
VQTLGEVPEELKVTAEQDERLAEQANRVGGAAVVRLLDLVANALRAMKDGADARTQLELALIKAARPEHDPSLRALMARLERLEGRGSVPPAPHRPEIAATAAGRAAQEQTPPPQQPAAEAPAIVAASAEIDGGPAVTAVAVVEPDGRVSEPEVRVGVELDLSGVTELWPAVLADVRERSPMLHALMENARPSALAGGELTLSWAESSAFYKRKAEDPSCREQIATAIKTVTGSSLRLAYALAEEEAAATPKPELSDDELVDAFMREFDAEELPAEEES